MGRRNVSRRSKSISIYRFVSVSKSLIHERFIPRTCMYIWDHQKCLRNHINSYITPNSNGQYRTKTRSTYNSFRSIKLGFKIIISCELSYYFMWRTFMISCGLNSCIFNSLPACIQYIVIVVLLCDRFIGVERLLNDRKRSRRDIVPLVIE